VTRQAFGVAARMFGDGEDAQWSGCAAAHERFEASAPSACKRLWRLRRVSVLRRM